MKNPQWLGAAVVASRVPRVLPSPGPLILMYHGIGGMDGVPVALLEEQLHALAARRRVVPLSGAVHMLGRPEARNLAAITFDDGYRDFVELAVPVLSRHDMHATLFVPAGWQGKTNDWEAGRAAPRAIVSWRELRALDPAVADIGAHGLRHRALAGLAAADLFEETLVARDMLENACGREVTLFAYPYGQADDFDADAERAVEAAGFTAACSTRFGRGSSVEDRFRLRRVGIERGDSLAIFERKIDGGYDWVAWKEAAAARSRSWRRALTCR